jgi:hypothetical protein
MHRCLQIYELQSHIFDYIYSVEPACLAILARTCRTFNEAALEILWRELEDISPFIKSLPSHLWREDRSVDHVGVSVTTLVSIMHPLHPTRSA